MPSHDGTLATKVPEREIETRFSQAQASAPRLRFLKGPIPWDEISRAAALSGPALAVFLAVRHRTDISGEEWITLPTEFLAELGIRKDAKARSLRQLVNAGLVEVKQKAGNTARVRLAER